MDNPLPQVLAQSREEGKGLARDGAERLTRALERPLTGRAGTWGGKPRDGRAVKRRSQGGPESESPRGNRGFLANPYAEQRRMTGCTCFLGYGFRDTACWSHPLATTDLLTVSPARAALYQKKKSLISPRCGLKVFPEFKLEQNPELSSRNIDLISLSQGQQPIGTRRLRLERSQWPARRAGASNGKGPTGEPFRYGLVLTCSGRTHLGAPPGRLGGCRQTQKQLRNLRHSTPLAPGLNPGWR